MKQSSVCVVAALVMAPMSAAAALMHHGGLGFFLGLGACYFLWRAEVLQRSGQ
jgi:hypothetical protein